MRANARFARAQHARALCHHLVARGDYVINLETNMVLAAGGVLLQKTGNGACVIYRFDQLDLAVRQINKTNPDTLFLHGKFFVNFCRAQHIAIKRNALRD